MDNDGNRFAFGRIHESNAWTCGSGPGSTTQSTLSFRYFLEAFVAANSVKSIVDFGCGDFQFMQHFPPSDISYVGFDVVEALIRSNNTQFATPRRQFRQFEGDLSELPEGDLLICKDVMIHWPNAQIMQFLEGVLPKYRFSLLVNDMAQSSLAPRSVPNRDIAIGGFRALRLDLPPFSLRGAIVHEYYGSLDDGELFWKKAVHLSVR